MEGKDSLSLIYILLNFNYWKHLIEEGIANQRIIYRKIVNIFTPKFPLFTVLAFVWLISGRQLCDIPCYACNEM